MASRPVVFSPSTVNAWSTAPSSRGGPAKFQVKDLRNALKAAEQLGLNLPITKLIHKLFDDMVNSGNADMDHSGLITHLEELNNISFSINESHHYRRRRIPRFPTRD